MFDGVFKDLITDKRSNDKDKDHIKTAANNKTPVKPIIKTLDPRPDLNNDTILWQQMLAAAQDRDPNNGLYAALLYMRTKGTVLWRVKNKEGKHVYVLRPYIDPAGNDGWANVQEYEAEKHKVLDQVRDKLIDLLKDM